MAILQISKIQVRSGNVSDLPQLSVGELGFATDTNQLFIGNDTGSIVGPTPDNTQILTQSSPVAYITSVPASSTATGTPGQIAYDSSYIYVCTATDVWHRVQYTPGSW
jgi:hypothetical protein